MTGMTVIIGLAALILFVLGLVICVQGLDQHDPFVFYCGVAFVVIAAFFLVFH